MSLNTTSPRISVKPMSQHLIAKVLTETQKNNLLADKLHRALSLLSSVLVTQALLGMGECVSGSAHAPDVSRLGHGSFFFPLVKPPLR